MQNAGGGPVGTAEHVVTLLKDLEVFGLHYCDQNLHLLLQFSIRVLDYCRNALIVTEVDTPHNLAHLAH